MLGEREFLSIREDHDPCGSELDSVFAPERALREDSITEQLVGDRVTKHLQGRIFSRQIKTRETRLFPNSKSRMRSVREEKAVSQSEY